MKNLIQLPESRIQLLESSIPDNYISHSAGQIGMNSSKISPATSILDNHIFLRKTSRDEIIRDFTSIQLLATSIQQQGSSNG